MMAVRTLFVHSRWQRLFVLLCAVGIASAGSIPRKPSYWDQLEIAADTSNNLNKERPDSPLEPREQLQPPSREANEESDRGSEGKPEQPCTEAEGRRCTEEIRRNSTTNRNASEEAKKESDRSSVSPCTEAKTCQYIPNVLAEQASYDPIRELLDWVDFSAVLDSTRLIIDEFNRWPSNPHTTCLDHASFNRQTNHQTQLVLLSVRNKFDVMVPLNSLRTPPPGQVGAVPKTNINVMVVFRDLLSFGNLGVNFTLDETGRVNFFVPIYFTAVKSDLTFIGNYRAVSLVIGAEVRGFHLRAWTHSVLVFFGGVHTGRPLHSIYLPKQLNCFQVNP